MTEITVKEGELVWHNERKGYGFVKIDDTEVFLHRSALDRFSLVRLLKGDRVTVSLTVNEPSMTRSPYRLLTSVPDQTGRALNGAEIPLCHQF